MSSNPIGGDHAGKENEGTSPASQTSRKAATTQAGEYVKEEMHHMKGKEHPVKNKKQAIAIGLVQSQAVRCQSPKKESRSDHQNPSPYVQEKIRCKASYRRPIRSLITSV